MRTLAIQLLIFLLTPSITSAEIIQHPYVKIPYEGILIQDERLSEKEWDAITLAVNHAIKRTQAAIVSSEQKNFKEARNIINSSLILLTLVKVAIPSFSIQESDDPQNLKNVHTLLIKLKDSNGNERVVDVILMIAFLENAIRAIDSMSVENVRLFLGNATQSIVTDKR